MTSPPNDSASTADWLDQLRRPETYGAASTTEVTLHETHISWLFLCGDDAYKVKKPIHNDFVDYSTLSRRKTLCHEEVRLNRRYVNDLYRDVVTINREGERLRINGDGAVLDYAVKMRRFPEDALLRQHLHKATVTSDGIGQLAASVADFHDRADRVPRDQPFGTPDAVLHDAMANLETLSESSVEGIDQPIQALTEWTQEFYQRHHEDFARRRRDGFVRECHGDLHSENVIFWQGRWAPFDGIEFNPAFRWIDVLADVAFLGMDLAAQGHLPLGRTFLSSYLEQTGDYEALHLYRFYLVYRALVRAKVAAMRAGQEGQTEEQRESALDDCRSHVDLATEWTTAAPPSLWITHGVSGSGKSTGSETIVQRRGAIRLRSDVERKRMWSNREKNGSEAALGSSMYSEEATRATYQHLASLADGLLQSGYPVIVDATFLKETQRQRFAELARSRGVAFHILWFAAEDAVLRQRIRQRAEERENVSDADLEVLDLQQRTLEPLTATEKEWTIEMPAAVTAIEPL